MNGGQPVQNIAAAHSPCDLAPCGPCCCSRHAAATWNDNSHAGLRQRCAELEEQVDSQQKIIVYLQVVGAAWCPLHCVRVFKSVRRLYRKLV